MFRFLLLISMFGAGLAQAQDQNTITFAVDSNNSNTLFFEEYSANFDPFTPVFTMGYETTLGNHWSISANIGAIYINQIAHSAKDLRSQNVQSSVNTTWLGETSDFQQAPVHPFLQVGVSFAF